LMSDACDADDCESLLEVLINPDSPSQR
jgi:hypothetical protein